MGCFVPSTDSLDFLCESSKAVVLNTFKSRYIYLVKVMNLLPGNEHKAHTYKTMQIISKLT